MPVRPLPSRANLDHLKQQAKDLMKAHAGRSVAGAQLLREFHPRLADATDEAIFSAPLKLSDAQLTIARGYGFASWVRLKTRVERPARADNLELPHHERIDDAVFRRAVDLLDAGDAEGLRVWVLEHPHLVRQRAEFEGGNYFRNPSLLEFTAENPIRYGRLPENIVAIAEVILDAGAQQAAIDETLGLVVTGRIVRECGVQNGLIDLLCRRGANPEGALHGAIGHGEFAAAEALIAHGARVDLTVAAGLERVGDFRRLLPTASAGDRHRALAVAAQFGHTEMVRLLLDAGEDPNGYNSAGFHSHSTPLHQAALAGHEEIVRLLVESGARLDMRDLVWNGTPADWAHHDGKFAIEAWLRGQENQE